MRNLSLEQRKDNTYYDKNGEQILEGDLLKVFHFIGARRKKHYMYQVVVMEDINFKNDPVRFPVMSVSSYLPNSKPHCRMYVLANNNRVHKTAEIVYKKDLSARKRIKVC